LTAVSAPIAVALVAMSWPLLHPPPQPPVAIGATPLRVFHSNLLYRNDRTADIAEAVAAVDADVVAFSEYTPEHSSGLLASPLADKYPYRIEHVETEAAGAALWSKYPLTEMPAPPARSREILASVAAPDPMVVYVVHTMSPLVRLDDWKAELTHLYAPPVEPGRPVLIVGDLNASYWHPAYREVLDRGWRDAHTSMGKGFSTSWPNDVRPVPNYVRIDHALVDDRLVVTEVEDVHVPGSDHVGFVVTVATAA
jgi:endonuclease/exonuclease/phosphatase (EEP) superfamily protein YafD